MNLEVIIIMFIFLLFIFILSFIEPIFMKYKVKNGNEQGGVTAISTICDSDSFLGIDFNIDPASIFESIAYHINYQLLLGLFQIQFVFSVNQQDLKVIRKRPQKGNKEMYEKVVIIYLTFILKLVQITLKVKMYMSLIMMDLQLANQLLLLRQLHQLLLKNLESIN